MASSSRVLNVANASDVSPVHLVLSHIQTITGTMRKNSRWASTSSQSRPRNADYGQLANLAGTSKDGTKSSMSGAEDGKREVGKWRMGEYMGEEELMVGFIDLRRRLGDEGELPSLPIVLHPFLSLIRSPLTTGPITSLSLQSLLSLLTLFPDVDTPDGKYDLTTALSDVSSAVTHCKFEASDSQGDEVVLLRILAIIETVLERWGGGGVAGDAGVALGDKEVCEMLETGLGMCCQMRLSEILRRASEQTVQNMVRMVFNHLKRIPVTDQTETVVTTDKDITIPAELHSMDPTGLSLGGAVAPSSDERAQVKQSGETTPIEKSEQVEAVMEVKNNTDEEPVVDLPFCPYGAATATELIRVLISLLNPMDQQHTDSMRMAALGILNTALEVAGACIGEWQEMRSMILDEGCKYLFQLTRSDSPNLLSISLKTSNTMFSTMRKYLKPQLELFLSYLIDRLAPPPAFSAIPSHARASMSVPGSPSPSPSLNGDSIESSITSVSSSQRPHVQAPIVPNEVRELMLNALSHLAGKPTFMVDLWVNYDCNMECEDLFERSMLFLTRGVYPVVPTNRDSQSDNQLVCLDILLSSVNHMARRVEENEDNWPSVYPTKASLAFTKSRKSLMLAGAAKFNTKPKLGLAFLEDNGLLVTEPGASKSRAIADLLKSSPRIDKKLLGDYISRPDNIEILKEFICMFDFKGKLVADAMRDLLESFRLPGESQQIARITETFAEIYFASGPAEIKSQDAVYVLAYSIIMLNTDLFSPQVRKKMAFEDYKRNLRGVNADSDFSDEFLRNIYDSIKRREIIMPEEHTGQFGFDYAWKELLARAPRAGLMLVCETSSFDNEMFQTVSKQVVSTIAYAFTTFTDDYVIQRAITGFRQCATLAGKFQLPEVFDHIVMALSQTTGLLDDLDTPFHNSNSPVVEVEGQSITVSSLSVRFGLNFKAQLAVVVLFTIANGNGHAIRDGWSQIFEMYQTLFLHSLLPAPMLQMEDFLGGTSTIPLQVAAPVTPREERRSDVGLLSTLSSYLLSPYGSSLDTLGLPSATDDEIEATLTTIDCLSSCKFEELYGQMLVLDLESMVSAVKSLKDLADKRLSVKPIRAPIPSKEDYRSSPGPAYREVQNPYDPASVFLLEMLVSISSKASNHIKDTWPIVFDHLSHLLSSAGQFSILLIERAVVGLLKLCVIISVEVSLRDQVFVSLDLLRSLPTPILNSVSEQLVAGVARVLEKDALAIKSPTEWGLILALLRGAVPHPEASKSALVLVEKVIAGNLGPGVTQDNLNGIVGILSEFAGFEGVATGGKQQKSRRAVVQSAAIEPAVERGLRAVDALFELKTPITSLMSTSPLSYDEAWCCFWLPSLRALGVQVVHGCREVRQRALGYLQRSLPGSPLVSHSHEALALIFEHVLFPMLDELLKPQVYMLDPQGMEETRLRASALLCRIFLVYFSEKGDEDITALWLRVVDVLDRFMNSGKPDQLYEAVPESLKNLLLVLNTSGVLVPPTESDTRTTAEITLWNATKERIDRFLPTFFEGIFPAPLEPPKVVV